MIKGAFILICLVLMMPPGLYCVSQDQFPRLKGPYLGQSPPGLKPVIFAPGIVSTERNELNPVFTPDGKYLFFTRNINRSGDIYWVDAKVIETFNPRQK